jgi:hydroxymethylpyrimidine pyrophosphatase-like HAD family hydrolase
MGNSPAAVKQAADSVTDDIDHDGIYNALKKLSCI